MHDISSMKIKEDSQYLHPSSSVLLWSNTKPKTQLQHHSEMGWREVKLALPANLKKIGKNPKTPTLFFRRVEIIVIIIIR